ncbi:hypothetical protein ANACOL_03533 [Anaerotruncus colihominis DSM 17241]|uniref:Uncharacterized protein n=1 Tax=Anaerotruncus colihominis DSM 17241 TaxID=445972 RepID=B0PFF3_9FIRM|nr:hypothetical protein ANACOL_03533 [Anaerotruncus colihominis DSM 17241]
MCRQGLSTSKEPPKSVVFQRIKGCLKSKTLFFFCIQRCPLYE